MREQIFAIIAERWPVGSRQRYEEATCASADRPTPKIPGDAADLSIKGYFQGERHETIEAPAPYLWTVAKNACEINLFLTNEESWPQLQLINAVNWQ